MDIGQGICGMRCEVERLAVGAARDVTLEVPDFAARIPVVGQRRKRFVHRPSVRSCRGRDAQLSIRSARVEKNGTRYLLTIIAAPRQTPRSSTVS